MTLTAKQEAFAQAIASGLTQADAYRSAYSAAKQNDTTLWANASRMAANTLVVARVAELRTRLQDKALWTRERSVKVLADIADSTESKAGEVVNAVKELNSMHGFNAPTKHELDVTFPRTINVISGRA